MGKAESPKQIFLGNLTFSVYSIKYSLSNYRYKLFFRAKTGIFSDPKETVNYDDLWKIQFYIIDVKIFPSFSNFNLKSQSTKNTIITQKRTLNVYYFNITLSRESFHMHQEIFKIK